MEDNQRRLTINDSLKYRQTESKRLMGHRLPNSTQDTHIGDCVEDRVGCHVEDIVLVADEVPGKLVRRFLGQKKLIADGGEEGDEPDENDQDAGATYRA